MGGCAAQTFNGVTQDQFDALLQKAAANGVNISGNSGSDSQKGITISWNYDPDAQTFTLECTDKPFLIPCGIINTQIQNLVSGALQGMQP